jgi:hypothetical protein
MLKGKSDLDARTPALVALVLLATNGCASQTQLLQWATARKIGCPADAVVITNVQRSGSRPATWNAACQDRSWACAREFPGFKCVAVEPLSPTAAKPAAARPQVRLRGFRWLPTDVTTEVHPHALGERAKASQGNRPGPWHHLSAGRRSGATSSSTDRATPGSTADQPAILQFDDHAVHGGWRDPEEALHVGLCGCPAVYGQSIRRRGRARGWHDHAVHALQDAPNVRGPYAIGDDGEERLDHDRELRAGRESRHWSEAHKTAPSYCWATLGTVTDARAACGPRPGH